MKIVVLDGHITNNGDFSWEELNKLGNCTIYDRTSKDQLIERIKDADIIFTNKTPISKNTLSQCKNLKFIGVLATGYNIVDIKAARENNIAVTNVPDYSTNAVAQLVFAHLLNICHHVEEHNESVKEGGWEKSLDFSYWNYKLIELPSKTLGIVGLGSIGYKVAKIAEAFGMKILAYSRNPKKELETENIKYCDLDYLYKNSDIISLHCPLSEHTEKMINKETIEKMKDGVILINTARGGLIDEGDLKEALGSGKAYMAGVDVASREPITKENPLLSAKNCIITPHIGWAPVETRKRLIEMTVSNLKSFLEGNPINVVN